MPELRRQSNVCAAGECVGELHVEALETVFRMPARFDLGRTLAPLRHGPQDPSVHFATTEVWRASWTPEGAATLHLTQEPGQIRARAWGAGAGWLLGGTPGLLGCDDEPASFRPAHPVLMQLHRRFAGLRICRTRAVVETLVPSILEQKVTTIEAVRSYRALIIALGEPAPGPSGLLLPPSAEQLAALPYWRFHPMGIERKRAEIIRRVCAQAGRLETLTSSTSLEGQRRLQTVPGVGPWTASEVARIAWGDADAVRLGDFHLPGLVSWALAGERRADDARMLELLEPYRGHRGRAVRLLQLGGRYPPRRAPRMATRSIRAL